MGASKTVHSCYRDGHEIEDSSGKGASKTVHSCYIAACTCRTSMITESLNPYQTSLALVSCIAAFTFLLTQLNYVPVVIIVNVQTVAWATNYNFCASPLVQFNRTVLSNAGTISKLDELSLIFLSLLLCWYLVMV
jgi:hypothetical protein